jgi:hypothetical protein
MAIEPIRLAKADREWAKDFTPPSRLREWLDESTIAKKTIEELIDYFFYIRAIECGLDIAQQEKGEPPLTWKFTEGCKAVVGFDRNGNPEHFHTDNLVERIIIWYNRCGDWNKETQEESMNFLTQPPKA